MLGMNLSIAHSLWKRQRERRQTGFPVTNPAIVDAEAKLTVLTFAMMLTMLVGLVCQVGGFET